MPQITMASLQTVFTRNTVPQTPNFRTSKMMGTVQMTNGSPVQGDGIAAVDGNAAGMCEYFGTLSLEAAPDNGTAHDLYVNFLAGPNATFLLDTFGCEQPNASTITVQLVHSSSFSNLN